MAEAQDAQHATGASSPSSRRSPPGAREAQRRNVPRNRIVRDEALTEIAAHHPTTAAELARTRGLSRGFAEGRMGEAILAVVAEALALPEAEWPAAPPGSNCRATWVRSSSS